MRLVEAAVDLFTEQGYDATTVSQIAERAGGLTRTTFFRHFADKREVLFAGQDVHRQVLADAIAAAPDSATPLEMVASALDALTGWFGDDRREFSTRVRAIMDANSELRERAVFKRVALAQSVTDALHERGVPDPAAGLAADLCVRAFFEAYERWADPAGPASFTDTARQAFDELRTALATLS
ncbi:TetR/AcrR family transcriptional regulator [Frankia sp. R82]|nr:TetR/AcrR family transcriptional regulator [Frankia sp. R82]MCM3886583.1 TetR/AcrR family transcriptional regulator [Frankia sp. R82]